jgi:hypothetical protein
MEILGRSIPNLQNAIASGLDSVTAGLTESTKASGVAALGIAQESFSFEQIGGSAELPAVAVVAEYPDPAQYFQRFSGAPSGSPISTIDIARTLTDRQFRADKSLQTFSLGSDRIIDEATNSKPQTESKDRTVFIERKQKEIEDKMREINELQFQKERQITYAEGVSAGSSRGSSTVEGAAAVGTSNDASNRSIIVVGGKAGDASDRSIIVVGGKVSDASDRSIIVVGGRTYFQTIDESFYQLQQNPTPQTADLLRQQFGAVQDMIMTVDQTVQLQQNLSANVLLGSLRR